MWDKRAVEASKRDGTAGGCISSVSSKFESARAVRGEIEGTPLQRRIRDAVRDPLSLTLSFGGVFDFESVIFFSRKIRSCQDHGDVGLSRK